MKSFFDKIKNALINKNSWKSFTEKIKNKVIDKLFVILLGIISSVVFILLLIFFAEIMKYAVLLLLFLFFCYFVIRIIFAPKVLLNVFPKLLVRIVTNGENEDLIFDMKKPFVSVGKGETCDIKISCNYLSDSHFYIYRKIADTGNDIVYILKNISQNNPTKHINLLGKRTIVELGAEGEKILSSNSNENWFIIGEENKDHIEFKVCLV